jgi:DNA invertase Pin-like site-specific DNA recombinase
MPKAISYIRFSSGKQAKGSSKERQEQAFNGWLVENPEYTPSDLQYKDLGKSGYSGAHIATGGGWAMLLEAVEHGAISAGDCVLVEAIDRTGRLTTIDMLYKVIIPILQAGISIITLEDTTTYTAETVNTPQIHLLIAKIQAAHEYSKSLSRRIRDSYTIRRTKAKNGECVKRYVVAWLTTDGVLKADIAPYIQQVFDWYISGVGKHAIASRLRASGVPEFEKCSGNTVLKWLKNKTAVGYWGDIPNVYPAVVTPEVFQQAQNRQLEVTTNPKTYTSKNHLVGLIKCGTCGGGFGVVRKSGKITSMRCNRLQRVDDCSNKQNIPYAVIHQLYLSSAPAWVDKAMKAIELTDSERRKLILSAERNEVTTSIQNLTRLLAKTKYNSPELEAEFEAASERRRMIDEELSILDRSTTNDTESDSKSFIVGYEGMKVHDRLAIHDPVQLSSLLKRAGYSITIHPGKKLFLPDDSEPWVYKGILRNGNATLGYRIQDGEMEYVISSVMPELSNEDMQSDHLTHLFARSYKHIRSPKSLNSTGERNVKGITTEPASIMLSSMKNKQQKFD